MPAPMMDYPWTVPARLRRTRTPGAGGGGRAPDAIG